MTVLTCFAVYSLPARHMFLAVKAAIGACPIKTIRGDWPVLTKEPEVDFLQSRIHDLEEKVDQLRLSRRVLMNLIEKIERERAGAIYRLEKEKKKLKKDNCCYARKLINKNQQIVELQMKLQTLHQHNSSN